MRSVFRIYINNKTATPALKLDTSAMQIIGLQLIFLFLNINESTAIVALNSKKQQPMNMTIVNTKLDALTSFSLRKAIMIEKLANAKTYVVKIIVHNITNSSQDYL